MFKVDIVIVYLTENQSSECSITYNSNAFIFLF